MKCEIYRAAARSGQKVLHLDHNDYYGGYTSSNSLGHFEKMLKDPQGGEILLLYLTIYLCGIKSSIRSCSW